MLDLIGLSVVSRLLRLEKCLHLESLGLAAYRCSALMNDYIALILVELCQRRVILMAERRAASHFNQLTEVCLLVGSQQLEVVRDEESLLGLIV